MACFNRNTQEYKDLLGNFNSNLKVDGIITGWQLANNSDKFPTVAEANLFLKNKKIAFNLKKRDFSDVLLSNLVNKRLISKYKDAYWVVNSNRASRVYDEAVLQSNLSQIKRYLQINNIPVEALQFTRTRQSIKIAVDDSIFSPKDLLESSRSWDTNKSKHVIVHLMRLFPNLRIEMTTVAKAKAYYDSLPAWQKANVKFEKVNSYFDPVASKVFLVEGRVTDETAIEEILHPFTDALYIENRALFNSLLEEAKINFPVLKQQIENSYSDKLGFTKEDREFELVTQALSRYFKKEFEENPTKTFKERIKEFLDWFAGIINNLHKYITGINISSLRSSEVVQPTQTGTIKPGVEELFESNPELANVVYEALGFKTNKINLDFEVINTEQGILINAFFNEKNVGFMDIQKSGNNYFVRSVKSNFKNQGIGTEIYKKAIEYVTQQKGVLKPDMLSASESYSIYKKLEKENLFKIDSVSEQDADGRYEIIGQSTGKIPSFKITPQQKQQAQQLYSQYLDSIFPDSKVKDIVYHGSKSKELKNFSLEQTRASQKQRYPDQDTVDAFFFTPSQKTAKAMTSDEAVIYSIILDVKNPLKVTNELAVNEGYPSMFATIAFTNSPFAIDKYRKKGYDAFDSSDNAANEYVVFEPEQIHILGNKQDIEGFKEFVSGGQGAQVLTELTTINLQDIKPTTTLSDIAKLLNTSDIKFDMKASANNKIRFSLTPELQSVVDFALSQSNETQSIIIKKLFHQAQELKDEVGSLSAGEDGPIVVLNEENHIYYNVLDTTEVFKSTTERIKGTFSEEDLFNKKLNLDLGNDFDKLLQAIASDKSFDDVFSSMKVLSKEQAGKAYIQLRENLNELTRGGGVAIPQVVVYDRVSRTAGTIDILIVLPNGKLKIVDLKTSKNSISEMAAGDKNLKYDTTYNLAIDSDLRKLGVEKLSTRSQQGLQVNIYRRMLENMGYEVDESDTGASTFHIQVGVSGKDAEQKFTGEFRSDQWVLHPLSQNSLYVDLLVPKNKDLFNEEQIDSAVDKALSSTVNWNEALTEDEKAPENNEDYTEFEVITQALESYKIGLTKKLQAVDSIKSSIFMDRSKEETREDIANGLSLINLALSESTEGRSAIFTDLVRDAIRQMDKFIDYMQNPNNFNKPEYITYALNTSRFIKTFEGLHSVKDLKGFNNTQTRLILELIARLNRVGANNNPNDENIIDTAITNYVKEQIKTWSSRDNLTEDILDDLIKGTAKEVRDIGTLELNAMDMATSRDIILAIMDKIYKVKKQEVLEKAEERNRLISELSSRLLKLSPGKNVQDIYDFMLEFDENGEFTGDYVKKIGRQYYDKLYELRDKLTDENGNFLEYRVIEDITTASKEDIEFNVKLAKIKAAYASFWSAERIGLDDKLMDGEYHSYTDEFKALRAKYQYYVEVNGKPIWRKKASVSDRAYQIYLAKYFNSVTYTYAVKDQNGNFTGATIPGREFLAPKPEYKIVNDYNKRTGESLLSKKYESIINPTDALGNAQKDFYLAFSNIYENELLNKLAPGVRSQMLGSVPVIKGKLFQDIKNKPNPVAKLWSSMTRSLKDLVSETTEQRGVVLDENGNIVDSLPVFYTGKLRNNEELEALNNEINDLNERLKKGLIKKLDYDEQIKILNARLIDVRSRPSKGELNKDMGTALMMFSTMAEHYEVMSGAEDTYRAFIKVLEKRQYQPSDKGTVLGTFTKGKFKAQGLISGADSNVLKRAKKWMSMVYYNSDDINKNFITKALDGLITYSSLSYVAFNPFGNFNNYALGRINNSIEALGGRFFSGSAYSRAEYEFNTQAIQSLIYRTSAASMKIGGKSDYDPKLPSNKYEALVDYFRMMDAKSDIRETVSGPQPIQKSYFSKFADLGYIFQDAAEYNVQTKTGMAILMDTMIMNSNTGDILSLYDAYEFDNSTKTVKLKNGYDKIVSLDPKNIDKNGKPNIIKESDFTDNYRYLIRNNIREVNKQIHGNYALDDRMVIQTHALGRLVAQFHKWVIPAINARFRSEYFDENLGWMEGRYRSFWKFLAYTTKKVATLQVEFGKHQENFMSEYGYVGDNSQSDQRAKDKLFGAYRTLGEIGFIMVSFALSSIFGSLFANDDEDDDTEFEKRMKNFLRYQTDRTYKELILFTPLGAKQVWQMFDSPIAATRTLGELGEALSLSVTTPIAYLIKGKEEFYLDKDYVYQRGIRKGELKLYKNWNDVIPILYSIKKWQDFNNLTNFYIK